MIIMEDEESIEENDCCGNGCSNCILDAKATTPKLSVNLQGKRNIISNYNKFILLSGKRLLEDVLELKFASYLTLANDSNLDGFILNIPAGHHVMMRRNDKKNLLRPYSPFWVDMLRLEFKLLVNLNADGPMSKFIRNLKEGDEVEFRGPFGSEYEYKIDKRGEKYIFIITQGVAIAPAIRIIEEILSEEEDETRIVHFACFTDLHHTYFREKLNGFNQFWNYSSYIFLSRQQCGGEDCLRNGQCLDDCKDFLEKLRYKERVYSRRLDILEIKDKCDNITGCQRIFIIAGSRAFQNSFHDLVQNELGICDENIYLL